jgi:multiple sugar transport system substrate-binding protein
MKRSLTIGSAVAVAAAVALLAAGCSSGSNAGSADKPVTITLWGSYGNGGNSTQQDALNKTLIPSFE